MSCALCLLRRISHMHFTGWIHSPQGISELRHFFPHNTKVQIRACPISTAVAVLSVRVCSAPQGKRIQTAENPAAHTISFLWIQLWGKLCPHCVTPSVGCHPRLVPPPLLLWLPCILPPLHISAKNFPAWHWFDIDTGAQHWFDSPN